MSDVQATGGNAFNFTREELQDIRSRAEDAGSTVPNWHWRAAYNDLAQAADHLDAMIARCTVEA